MTTRNMVPCFHVTTTAGDVYGVAATCKRDAIAYTDERLARDESTDRPASADRVGSWKADIGTVLAY